MIKPNLGSVSHGTLRKEDLIPRFSEVLKECVFMNDLPLEDFNDLIHEANTVDFTSDRADSILEELFDALNEFAPDNAIFGAHEGDGSDFGFWELENDNVD